MKKALFFRILSLFVLGGMMEESGYVACQCSEVYNYPSVFGNHILMRTNYPRTYTVISLHDSHNCSSFIVDDHTTRKMFATTSYNAGPTPEYIHKGYIVNDMAVQENICWFCGEEWIETGNSIYIWGQGFIPEVLHYGYIGRFDVTEVMNGAGHYEIMRFSETKELTSMAVYTGGVTAIGTLEYNDQSCVVEMAESGGTTYYLCRVDTSTFDEEVFMDVVWAGGKVITLSRFKNPNHTAYNKTSFGLRYGTPSNFGNTSNMIYRYDVYYLWGDNVTGQFDGLSPIRLAYSNIGNEVWVSYLGTTAGGSSNPMAERVLMYGIAAQGSNSVKVMYNSDSERYKELIDFRFNVHWGNLSLVSLLMENISGASVIRYPKLNHIGTTNYDTVLYTDIYKLESVMPLFTGSEMSIFAAGNDSSLKLHEIKEWEVNNFLSLCYQMNCLSVRNAQWRSFEEGGSLFYDIKGMQVRQESVRGFSQYSYSSRVAGRGRYCLNGE